MSESIYPKRWPPRNPERLQLYSMATPNGRKIGVALEEMGLAYDAHKIDIGKGDQFDPDYLRINPNGKIPSIIDPDGPSGTPIALMESGAILLYLADKTGKLMGHDLRTRWDTMQWIFFQVGHVGPMFGQFGHFHHVAKDKTDDEYAHERYTNEVKRLLGVLETRLRDRDYLLSTYSIADIATFPWIAALDFYQGKDAVEYTSFPRVNAWVERCLGRPAVQRGFRVCA